LTIFISDTEYSQKSAAKASDF